MTQIKFFGEGSYLHTDAPDVSASAQKWSTLQMHFGVTTLDKTQVHIWTSAENVRVEPTYVGTNPAINRDA